MKTTIIFLALFITLNARAQSTTNAEIKKVITGLFAAMQQADTATMRKLFMPRARLQTALINTKTGKTKLETEPIDSFLSNVAAIRNDTMKIEERITAFRINIDDPMADVWAPYEFYLNGKVWHTGVDAFQLFRSADGWKIIQICDTRHRK